VLKTETSEISCWYDFEAVRSLAVFCGRCGAKIPDEELFTEGAHVCQCGKIAKLVELDALADSMEKPIPKIAPSKQ
jgi:hypothetical protein